MSVEARRPGRGARWRISEAKSGSDRALGHDGNRLINAEYALPHLPAPGETLAASGLERFLGGKGANMSVAAARAGSRVSHIGAVGPTGAGRRIG